jgi:hypothetical protein
MGGVNKMNLSVSLETAKKLKEAGWNKPTALVYTNYYHGEPTEKMHLEFPVHTTDPNKLYAPTTDEILADLPKTINGYANSDNKNVSYIVAVFKGEDTYFAGYFFYGIELIVFKNKSLVEALAELWLWAKEKGYIKAEKAKEA